MNHTGVKCDIQSGKYSQKVTSLLLCWMLAGLTVTPPCHHHITWNTLTANNLKDPGGPEKKTSPKGRTVIIRQPRLSLPYVCKQTCGSWNRWCTSFLLSLSRNSAPSVAGLWVQVGDFPVNVSQLAADLHGSARFQCRGLGWVLTCICMLFCCETGHHLQSVSCPSACVNVCNNVYYLLCVCVCVCLLQWWDLCNTTFSCIF